MKKYQSITGVLALLALVLLASSGCTALMDLLSPPAPQPPAEPFEGLWQNEDSSTDDITRIDIAQEGSQVSVHVWASCSPSDCDWGTEKGFIDGGSAQITWDQGFVIRKMTLTLLGTHRMRVVTESVYDDDRPRRTSEGFFFKT